MSKTAAIKELLSDPSFDPQPYFGDAVISLVGQMLGRILTEHPKYLKYFVVESCIRELGRHLQFDDDSFTVEVLEFLQFPDNNHEWRRGDAIESIFKRVPDEKVHLVARHASLAQLDCISFLRRCNGAQISEIALRHDPDLWYKEQIKDVTRCVTGAYVAANSFDEAVMHMSTTSIPEVAMGVAIRCRLSKYYEVMAHFDRNFDALQCYKCGNTYKSQPGISNHRRNCDPDNMWPNPIRILQKRKKGKINRWELDLPCLRVPSS